MVRRVNKPVLLPPLLLTGQRVEVMVDQTVPRASALVDRAISRRVEHHLLWEVKYRPIGLGHRIALHQHAQRLGLPLRLRILLGGRRQVERLGIRVHDAVPPGWKRRDLRCGRRV